MTYHLLLSCHIFAQYPCHFVEEAFLFSPSHQPLSNELMTNGAGQGQCAPGESYPPVASEAPRSSIEKRFASCCAIFYIHSSNSIWMPLSNE